MEIRTLAALPATDISQVSEARRVAVSLARTAGFNEAETGKVAIVVTEAATNLARHAREGELIFNALTNRDQHGIAMLALDRGPGIRNVADSLRDGYSTAGTPGGGLGAIVRLSSDFDIHSLEGVGTALLARFWPGPARQHAPLVPVELGAISVPKSGEEVCGDGWGVLREPRRVRLFVVDGLGHGFDAAKAATAALEVFQSNPRLNPVELLQAVHGGLRHTRGAVAAVACLDTETRLVRYAGVGNISAAIWSPTGQHDLVSLPGTLGQQVRKIQDFTYQWPEDGLLIIHSDGISRRWDLKDYPGLTERSPALVAAVLHRDFKREQDDSTVVVARETAQGGVP